MSAGDSLSGEQFRLYRAEARPDGEDLSRPESVGVHWTTRPIDYHYDERPGFRNRVVWHADVPAHHVADTSDRFNEGEVVLHPGAQVTLHGRTTRKDKWGHVDVQPEPEHPMNHSVVVKGRQIK